MAELDEVIVTDTRKDRIITALVREIERQSEEERTHAPFISQRFGLNEYVIDGTIDLDALARAVLRALDGAEPGVVEEGTPPEALNATNDD